MEEEAEEEKLDIEKQLPILLSIQRRRKTTPLVRGIIPTEKKMTRRKKPTALVKTMEQIMQDIKEVTNSGILNMLNDSRAENYDDWMNVGWTLFNIGNGIPEALELWIDFSARAPNFDQKKCEYLWDQMEMKGKGIGSLYQMAKNDNPEKYAEWKKTKCREDLDAAIKCPKPTHANVAKLIHTKYSDKFVCADAKSNIWYEYRGHRWTKMDDANELMRIISFELPDTFRLEISALSSDAKQATDPNAQLAIKRCLDLQAKLQMDSFATGVMRMCKRLFLNERFLEKLDQNKDIMGMEDGVVDLKMGIFRDGSPDDYISISTGLQYREFSESDKSVIECRKFLKKLFPTRENTQMCNSHGFFVHAGRKQKQEDLHVHRKGTQRKVCLLQSFGIHLWTVLYQIPSRNVHGWKDKLIQCSKARACQSTDSSLWRVARGAQRREAQSRNSEGIVWK
ncbi:hypothetical protein GMAR_ORF96 [Golden Marseillevirus]|uniref:hypothetical protein n=1 Tax=Golden Marseillevirus TaxID=1720526 RepID=UPI000877A8BB|nr:hypothetical protein GMAR_ORF96 [Golden Marseillevirus]ALX27470.1 hypothetical protein GMAR_ORF96 [Golden Marseillevirus]